MENSCIERRIIGTVAPRENPWPWRPPAAITRIDAGRRLGRKAFAELEIGRADRKQHAAGRAAEERLAPAPEAAPGQAHASRGCSTSAAGSIVRASHVARRIAGAGINERSTSPPG